ncbi:hypothetical protein EU514_01450 [Pseudomonas fragi]|nr:hypothetical protein [Pseudomonas fragi]
MLAMQTTRPTSKTAALPSQASPLPQKQSRSPTSQFVALAQLDAGSSALEKRYRLLLLQVL